MTAAASKRGEDGPGTFQRMTRPPSYFIGVDTGGTYTDAAVIEEAGHKVVASAKALTTKGLKASIVLLPSWPSRLPHLTSTQLESQNLRH